MTTTPPEQPGKKRVGVLVARHAVERLQERHPYLGLDDVVKARSFIYGEVQAALAMGRRCSSEPSWLLERDTMRLQGTRRGSARRNLDAHHSRKKGGTNRYVWDPTKWRVYRIQKRRPQGSRERDHEFKESWLVVTVLDVPANRRKLAEQAGR